LLEMRLREIENTKSQILNPKQYQMTKIPMSQGFEFRTLEFRICLELRNQDLGFNLWEVRHEIYY
jgi:hypothetical protein